MIDLWNMVAYRWWEWMGSMFWQASLLILVVSGLDLSIRRWVWPQVRYVLWLLIFVKLLITPGWHLSTAVVPRLFGETQELLGRVWDWQFPMPAAVRPAESALRESAAIPQPVTGPGEPDSVAPGASAELLPQAYLFGFWLAGKVNTVYCRMITREISYFLWFKADSRFFSMEESWKVAKSLSSVS